MATVQEVLDQLVGGQITLQAAADDFAARQWPMMPETTEAEAWGVTDASVPPEESWADVQNDPRLTSDQYAVLGAAYRQAVGQR